MENGETTEDDRLGYASGSNTFRDRPNHHSRRHKNVLGDDSGHGGAQQGKNGTIIKCLCTFTPKYNNFEIASIRKYAAFFNPNHVSYLLF